MKKSGKVTAIVIPLFIVLYLLPYSTEKKWLSIILGVFYLVSLAYYYKKEKDNPSMFNNGAIEDAEILVLKNRDGRVGVAKVSFEGKSARFLNRIEIQPTIIEFE